MTNKWSDRYEKYFNARSMCYTKCKCGKTVWIFNKDRAICSECGYYVYKDKKTEFIYKLKMYIEQEKIKELW